MGAAVMTVVMGVIATAVSGRAINSMFVGMVSIIVPVAVLMLLPSGCDP